MLEKNNNQDLQKWSENILKALAPNLVLKALNKGFKNNIILKVELDNLKWKAFLKRAM